MNASECLINMYSFNIHKIEKIRANLIHNQGCGFFWQIAITTDASRARASHTVIWLHWGWNRVAYPIATLWFIICFAIFQLREHPLLSEILTNVFVLHVYFALKMQVCEGNISKQTSYMAGVPFSLWTDVVLIHMEPWPQLCWPFCMSGDPCAKCPVDLRCILHVHICWKSLLIFLYESYFVQTSLFLKTESLSDFELAVWFW